MAMVKTGNGITDISGSIAGNVFARDSSGLHARPNPRRVKQRTAAQRIQRSAFAKARLYSKDNRTVSYLIYRALNNLPFIFDAIVTGDPVPDCTGRYLLAGKYWGVDYYERTDSAYALWYIEGLLHWVITEAVDAPGAPIWFDGTRIEGTYTPGLGASGNPIVQLKVQPPPPDYEPPRL